MAKDRRLQPGAASMVYHMFKISELRAAPYLTRLKDGARGRYIVRAPQIPTAMGSHCPLVQVKAVWFRPGSVPDFFAV